MSAALGPRGRRALIAELDAWSDAHGHLAAARARVRAARSPARAPRWWALFAGVACAAGLAWWLRPAPAPRYTVAGEPAHAAGRLVSVASHRTGRIAVSDGTVVTLGSGSRCRVAALSRRAGRLACDAGWVRVAGPPDAAAWTVATAAFAVAGTSGADFDVVPAPGGVALALDVRRGAVTVSGPCAEARRLAAPAAIRVGCAPALAGPAPPHAPVAAVAQALHARAGTPGAAADAALVGRWTFDDPEGSSVARDVSGHGNDARLVAVPRQGEVRLAPGRAGGALALSGQAYARVPASPSLDAIQTFTLAAWILREKDELAFDMIASRQAGDGSGEHLGLGLYDNQMTGLVETVPPERTVTDWGLVPDHRWVHVALTYDGESAVLYLDGAAVGRAAHRATLRPDATPLLIGANGNAGGTITEFFTGRIDDLRLYARALDADEIAALAGAAP